MTLVEKVPPRGGGESCLVIAPSPPKKNLL